MRIFLFYILVFILFCISCKQGRNRLNNSGLDAFAPVLRNKVEDFISYTDSISHGKIEKSKLYTLYIYEENDELIVFIGTDFFYKKKRIKGYAFMNDKLVVYNGNYSSRLQYLIDTSKLVKFVDTIPDYRSDVFIDRDYQVIKREYVVNGKDSLSLIFSGYY